MHFAHLQMAEVFKFQVTQWKPYFGAYIWSRIWQES